MNLITHIIEPDRLLLRWQSSHHHNSEARTHWIVGELIKDECNNGQLKYSSGMREFIKAQEYGFIGFPAFRKTDRVHTADVVETFMRRLPPRSREDFSDYLRSFCLDPSVKMSDFALLGYTGAKLPSDGFSIVHPFDNGPSPCELVIEIAGFRHYMNKVGVSTGDEVEFIFEPDNKFDQNAIRIQSAGRKIGYVSRGLQAAFKSWIDHHDIGGLINRVNGDVKRPRVFAYVAVR